MIDTDISNKQNRFKKIILHVGPDKTGSTSIQSSLKKNRNLLLSNRVSYPLNSVYPGHINHHILGTCFTTEPEHLIYNEPQLSIKQCEDILQSLDKSLSETQADTLVLSNEGFIHLTENAFRNMKKFLEKYGGEIEIVYYVRAPLSHAISAMSQHVKMCLEACEGGCCIHIHNHKDTLEKLICVFGKDQINVRPFSKELLPERNVVLDFLSLLDLPSAINKKIASNWRNKNISLSWEAQLIGEKMIEILDGYLSSYEFQHKRAIGNIFLPAIKGRRILLTDYQQEEILNASTPHLEYLSKEFGITIKDEPRAVYKQPSISEHTIDITAKKLLKVLVPDFKQPIEAPAQNEGKLNRFFILRVMLITKILIIILAVRHRFRSIILSLR